MRPTGRVVSRKPSTLALLAALLLGSGCGDAGPPGATMVEISPPQAVLQDARDTVRLTATVRDEYGEAMPWVPVTWSIRDSFVAQLSEDGLVTAEEPGEAVVEARAAGLRADATVVVEPGQRAVLHKIYRVMGGDDWRVSTNWRTDAPLHAWAGVWTDSEGNVTKLALNYNNVTGSMPAELGSLESLQNLQLLGNPVTGSIPPELGNLESITEMTIGGRDLTGPIPPELGNMRNLRALSLTDSRVTGPIPPELANLRNLEFLGLFSNQLTGPIPPELGTMENLDVLWLSSNRLTGPVPGELGNIPELRVMRIDANPLAGPLPRDLIGLPLRAFSWNNTDLCAPADDAFQSWLDGISQHEGDEDCD
ncbi:MAG: Ig-like domain-containing protein [Gemmatimonadota bacterium]|nr:Ig-like domain-containing protein [Gemmatimonadota bacterium]MDE2873078.1 Ig-like domain-containing protein [Gemmatimonadota bacterium]